MSPLEAGQLARCINAGDGTQKIIYRQYKPQRVPCGDRQALKLLSDVRQEEEVLMRRGKALIIYWIKQSNIIAPPTPHIFLSLPLFFCSVLGFLFLPDGSWVLQHLSVTCTPICLLLLFLGL